MTIEYPNAKDVIINLSDVVIKEVSNKKTPDYIKEKVISGEIVTGQQIKEERKNNSKALEKFSEEKEIIQEAEIVSEKLPYEKFEEVIRKIEKKLSDIEISSLDGNTEDIYNKLKNVLEILE